MFPLFVMEPLLVKSLSSIDMCFLSLEVAPGVKKSLQGNIFTFSHHPNSVEILYIYKKHHPCKISSLVAYILLC